MGYTVKDLGSDILFLENVLEPSLCQHVIEVAECCQFMPAHKPDQLIDADIRSGGILPLGEGGALQESTNRLLLGKVKIIQELLFKRYGIRFSRPEACAVLRYLPGQGCKRHVDNCLLETRVQQLEQNIPTRDVAIIGYLNDEFEGGENLFDRQIIKVKPRAGCAIAFPAGYTHPHQALPVVRGCKYVFTSWLFY